MAEPTATNPDGKFGIPGGAEIWQSPDGQWYVVYKIPETGTPLAWHLESLDDIAKVFGDADPKPDRVLSQGEWNAAGLLLFGSSRQLANLSEHPFDNWVANYETEAQVQPWLRDPGVLALNVRAMLEGRSISDSEMAGTEWFRSRTLAERNWMSQVNRDPSTAAQLVQDGRDATRGLMVQMGIANPPERLVRWLADRVTGGTWTQQYMQLQVSKLADPSAPGVLDSLLTTWASDVGKDGETLNTLAGNQTRVEELVRTWLGPAFSSTWSSQQREMWAGRLRNDPQAEDELVAELQEQRLSLFPEYADPSRSYEAIAAPWRGVWSEMWGETADESDPMFVDLVRANDLGYAQQRLRQVGVQRGNSQVVNSALSAIGSSPLGASVRRVM